MDNFLFECNVRVWRSEGMNSGTDGCEHNCTFVTVVCNYVYEYIVSYEIN